MEGIGYIVTGTFQVAIVDDTPELRGIGADVWIVVGLAVIPSAVLWAALAGRAGYARALAGAYLLQRGTVVYHGPAARLRDDVDVLHSAYLGQGTARRESALRR